MTRRSALSAQPNEIDRDYINFDFDVESNGREKGKPARRRSRSPQNLDRNAVTRGPKWVTKYPSVRAPRAGRWRSQARHN